MEEFSGLYGAGYRLVVAVGLRQGTSRKQQDSRGCGGYPQWVLRLYARENVRKCRTSLREVPALRNAHPFMTPEKGACLTEEEGKRRMGLKVLKIATAASPAAEKWERRQRKCEDTEGCAARGRAREGPSGDRHIVPRKGTGNASRRVGARRSPPHTSAR